VSRQEEARHPAGRPEFLAEAHPVKQQEGRHRGITLQNKRGLLRVLHPGECPDNLLVEALKLPIQAYMPQPTAM
jgi:hypothetical protein